MSYPASLDSVATVSTGQLITSAYVNSQSNAINNIENALLANPARAFCDGRLTLTTATAVTPSDVTGATTVYFTPFHGNRIAIYDGTSAWNLYVFTERSKALSGLTSGANYDLFVWNNSGTLTLSLGTAWTSNTARVSGAAGEIVLQDGVLVNKYADNSIPALAGRYVGTIRTTGTTTTEDSNARRYVFNAQNRVVRKLKAVDTTDTWAYSSTTFHQANAAAANKAEIVVGMLAVEDMVVADVHHFAANTLASVVAAAGIGIDSTTTNSADTFGSLLGSANQGNPLHASYRGHPGIGYHAINWLEAGASTGTTTFYGDNGSALMQTGLTGQVMA